MLSGSIDPIDLDIKAIIAEDLSPAARSRFLADVARGALKEAEQTDEQALGFKPQHTITVDGSVGADESKVKPDGTIQYSFNLLPDIFAWILEQLQAFAPVKTGAFKASFVLYADGQKINPLGQIPQAKEYVFMSSAEYAAQLEGYPGRAPESPQAPNGVFEAVAALANGRFGNQAQIEFSYRYPVSGDLLTVLNARASRNRGIRKMANRTFVLTPAITITLGS